MLSPRVTDNAIFILGRHDDTPVVHILGYLLRDPLTLLLPSPVTVSSSDRELRQALSYQNLLYSHLNARGRGTRSQERGPLPRLLLSTDLVTWSALATHLFAGDPVTWLRTITHCRPSSSCQELVEQVPQQGLAFSSENSPRAGDCDCLGLGWGSFQGLLLQTDFLPQAGAALAASLPVICRSKDS